MTKKWIEPERIIPPPYLLKGIGGHQLVAETLTRRGITDLEAAQGFINPDLYKPAPPSEIPNINLGADRIEAAIEKGETILVWGDFDVDGQTATTLLVEALYDLGGNVQFHIPNRDKEGHGINPEMLDSLLAPSSPTPQSFHPPNKAFDFVQDLPNKPPTLLLTCDTGISEFEAVTLGKNRGLSVIITDHHEMLDHLPDADVIINPHMLNDEHPLSTLPGVGVAYKLIEEIYSRRGISEKAEKYLDLTALGIVADVATQKGDTRYLLQRGLQKLRKTDRTGLQELYKTAKINSDNLDEGHIGYSIGPRLNALGRLSDANPIIEFLTTKNQRRAQLFAQKLEGLNQERRHHTTQIYEGAIKQLEREPEKLNYAVLVLSRPGWPKGVVGIVATRLVEKFGKPTILLNEDENGIASGSARSIEGIHITDAISEHANLLNGYGGHAGAAGLSLSIDNIPGFRSGLSRTVRRMAIDIDQTPKLVIDRYLPWGELSLDLVDDIERLSPFGAGNPALTLASKNLRAIKSTYVGGNKEHRRVVISDSYGNTRDVIWWQGGSEDLPADDTQFDLAYIVGSHTFGGERKLQITWDDYKPSSPECLEDIPPGPAIDCIDYRFMANPGALLQAIRERDEIQVWAEGEAHRRINGLYRHELCECKNLAIWSSPPSQRVFQNVIDHVKPDVIYLFSVDPGLDTLKDFLDRLAGITKHVVEKMDGRIKLFELAGAMAHTEASILLGMDWFSVKEFITWENDEEKGGLHLFQYSEDDQPKQNLSNIEHELKSILLETRAFRRNFSRAGTDTLFSELNSNK